MSVWGSFNLQEGMTVIMELMNYFHDHMMTLLTVIMLFVSYIFLMVVYSKGLDHFMVDSHVLELIWTIVPMFFLIFMALPSLYLLYMTEDLLIYSIVIKVIAHQWYWEYQYYNSDLNISFNSYMLNSSDISLSSESPSLRLLDVDNRLVLPYMSGSVMMVTSADVLHSWTVPSFGVKADAIPGRLNYINILPSQYGIFYGQCSELCGSNHSFMPIVVEVSNYLPFLNYISSLS